MIKILVVEDEELIKETIRINLEREHYHVTCCSDGEMMLEILKENYFDLILLDIMLPGISGEESLPHIRKMGIKTPVIMVTAKSDIQTKLSTFDTGADDYITKPFHIKELLARVRALIRRSQGERTIPSSLVMKIGPYTVDLDQHTAITSHGPVTLSDKEIKFLAYFNTHPNETLSRADILDEVWGMDADPTPRTIDNFILKFRRLFEENPESPTHFISIRTKGYRFSG